MGIGIDYIIGIRWNDIRIAGNEAPLKIQARDEKNCSRQYGEPHDEYIEETLHEAFLTHRLPGSMKAQLLSRQQAENPY
jgi:hypothetical protein